MLTSSADVPLMYIGRLGFTELCALVAGVLNDFHCLI